MLGCSPISDENVSKDEGLRKEILSKTHYSLNTVQPESTKMYKNEEKSGLEFSNYFSQVRYRRLLDCRLMKHFMKLSVSCPCDTGQKNLRKQTLKLTHRR